MRGSRREINKIARPFKILFHPIVSTPKGQSKNMEQRVIKFRCWSPDQERMIDSPFMFQETQEHDNETTPFTYYEDWRDWEDGIKRPCYVMQFTGLKDNNGKEIYESDILQDTEVPATYIVKWHQDKTAFDLYRVGDGEWISNYYSVADVVLACKLIGNIFENKELLKDTQR
jgi:uncharacterized phage protein (TIGR01671 family)